MYRSVDRGRRPAGRAPSAAASDPGLSTLRRRAVPRRQPTLQPWDHHVELRLDGIRARQAGHEEHVMERRADGRASDGHRHGVVRERSQRRPEETHEPELGGLGSPCPGRRQLAVPLQDRPPWITALEVCDQLPREPRDTGRQRRVSVEDRGISGSCWRRDSTIVCRARLSWRSPERLRRWRTVWPDEAGIGVTPPRLAKAASLRMRPACDQALSSRAALMTPTPGAPSSAAR